ncbi:hypothetical protein BDB00DRAFT_810128 [Zychaea mexicana]|uniref:uncharacterized protein n=1 Tax=Zychaea mexicana TaxID=64656 RepID=UPI0022FEE305|nr:uncharacterized protein BDB00DRAFT_810128 [Zychaea mexicana]KAI9496358.1 hypothetical protein BDB00DRAFT_810128 [Zychaea mexicana]
MSTLGCDSVQQQQQQPTHIPQAVLKVQFKRLVSQHNAKGVIFTRDLLTLIDEYEQQQDVTLLTLDQKTAIQPYTSANPDLEMSADDILNLLKLVFPTPTPSKSSSSSFSVTTTTAVRPRTSPPLSTGPRRLSLDPMLVVEGKEKSCEKATTEPIDEDDTDAVVAEPLETMATLTALAATVTTTMGSNITQPTKLSDVAVDEEDDEEQTSTPNVAQYYRRSIELTRRLKLSERSLASMTRDNEDRIVQLQNRVDDMNQEVVKQKREILEYKSKEMNSLEQITALEAHIAHIERSETDQKQVYLSIRKLFDEKCEETQDLQEMLRHKELALQKTEAFLSTIHHEFQQLNEERNKLMALQNNLERELATSHYTHMQLAEQRSENERLKEIIDGLKCDLEARSELSSSSSSSLVVVPSDSETHSLINTLRAELENHAEFKEDNSNTNNNTHVDDTEERIKSVENEKDYYKSQADAAMQDLDRVKREFKNALDQEKELLVNQLAHMGMEIPDRRDDIDNLRIVNHGDVDVNNTVEPFAIQVITNAAKQRQQQLPRRSFTDTTIDMMNTTTTTTPTTTTTTDIWDQSRIRQRKLDKWKKRGGVQDLNASTAYAVNNHIASLVGSAEGSSSSHSSSNNSSRTMTTRSNDRAVTNTATFAIYTLLVYIFGIVTSTFLLDGQPGSWEQALVAAATQQGGSRSKILEILIYWIEKLLFEGDGVPLS